MRRRDRAEIVERVLDSLYPSPSLPLQHSNCYTLLIAVVLSAQCTDARVNKVVPELFTHADNPYDMVELSVGEIEEIIRSWGLFSNKARAIRELSQQLIEHHHGEVPRTLKELEALPGVGHKTASVVLVQAFGIPAFPVDTHIHRCAKRWGLTNGQTVQQTEKDLKRLFPKEVWGKLHLQIIHFARRHCRAMGHDPKECPICSQLVG